MTYLLLLRDARTGKQITDAITAPNDAAALQIGRAMGEAFDLGFEGALAGRRADHVYSRSIPNR
jgi:hypothetical protein